jgi:hypothetical protein
VALVNLHSVADAAHLNLRHGSTFTGVKIFGTENDIKSTLFILDDVAFAQAAGDDFSQSYPLRQERLETA